MTMLLMVKEMDVSVHGCLTGVSHAVSDRSSLDHTFKNC